jgi:peptidoglycan/LPS O-acetylase OafA/YrhL
MCGFAAWLLSKLTSSRPSWPRRACEAGWLRWLGRHSYALYVFHLPLMHLLRDHWSAGALASVTARAAFSLVGIAGSTVLAWASWLFLEAQFLRLKDFFPRDEARIGSSRPIYDRSGG